MSGSLLRRCSSDECPNLIYPEEGTAGDRLWTYFDSLGKETTRLGLYCDECSMALGFFPQRLLDKIELMLRAEGMLDTKAHKRKPRDARPGPNQGMIL